MRTLLVIVGALLVVVAAGATLFLTSRQPADGAIEIPRREIAAELGDPTKLPEALKIIPHFKDRTFIGFRLEEIKPGSIAHRVGLRDGDVVRKVGDVDIDGIEVLMTSWDRFQAMSEAEVHFLRDGQPQSVLVRAVE